MTDRPQRLHTYRNAIFNSARWDAYRPRAGDVAVCTPPKCGTTWTIKLVAMLLHGSATLPHPVARMGRWVDLQQMPLGKLMMELDLDEGRRILKTHTPLDGLPFSDKLRYVFCGRDPRDAFLSMIDHVRNSVNERERGGAGDPDPNAVFPRWATVGEFPWMHDGGPFQSVLSHTETYWAHRRLPNLMMIHYRDLSEDLEGELRRLAAFLGCAVDDALMAELLKGGSFAEMRADPEQNAPSVDRGAWRNNQDFFRKGRLDDWREVLTPENQALYERVNAERVDPVMKTWIEGGRRAAGDPREL